MKVDFDDDRQFVYVLVLPSLVYIQERAMDPTTSTMDRESSRFDIMINMLCLHLQ